MPLNLCSAITTHAEHFAMAPGFLKLKEEIQGRRDDKTKKCKKVKRKKDTPC